MSRRALLTERERELLSGENSKQRVYEIRSRVRSRVAEKLTEDLDVLAEHHPDLLEELREEVCDG